jgi:glycosyltransferase involved in cell wall biosynthesis
LQKSNHTPLVTIGVPVYNGEQFISSALDSLLGQSLDNIELIISDNASTDSTETICRDFARRDARIRYFRQKRNIGAPSNWNFLVHEARGKYFKWASASDYCSPIMLEQCVNAMQDNLDIVVCTGLTQTIDENDKPQEVYIRDKSINEDSPSERFSHIMHTLSRNNIISGVIRLDVLRRTRLNRQYPSGDLVLMAELALHGNLIVLPEVYLFRRRIRDSFTSMLTPIELQRIHDPQAKSPLKLIHIRQFLDYIISISRTPTSTVEKLRAYQTTLRSMYWSRKILWGELLSLCTKTDNTK